MSTTPSSSPLFTDFYQLTMAAGYFSNNLFAPATFTVSVRNGKKDGKGSRGYYIFAGLADVLDILSEFSFSKADIDYLRETSRFAPDFLDCLARLKFTGDVMAIPEGTLFFKDEPLLEITAPMIEAQLVETVVLNTLGVQTMMATKAARCRYAAQGRPLLDFSLRRTQGRDAGMHAARSTWIAGFTGTSNVLAGKTQGIPVAGTMAHSYVTAFESELEAFMAYARLFPEATVLLIDTFDLARGAKHAVTVARYLKEKGTALRAVRLDSGDMVAGSRQVREILDQSGFPDVKIIASSGFDEYKIDALLKAGARIDAFGVGTKVGVCADAPFLDIVYKLAKFGDRNVKKFSPGKMTLAGRKQVFRKTRPDGALLEDIIGLRDESPTDATGLLEPVMAAGRLLKPHPPLDEIRANCDREMAALADDYKSLECPPPFPVKISARLSTLQRELGRKRLEKPLERP